MRFVFRPKEILRTARLFPQTLLLTFASKLNLNKSNDVPPHTLIHTLVMEGRIYRSSALFGRRKRKGWQLERILKLSSSRRVQTRIGGTNILEASSHVRVMKEKRKREIRRFYFFFLGEKEELRNRAEEEKKDSSGNLLSRVVSSEIESRALFCENEKKEERKRN